MQERFQWCKSTIEALIFRASLHSTHLDLLANRTKAIFDGCSAAKHPTVFVSCVGLFVRLTGSAIASMLQAQHGVFVSIAAKTATVDAESQKLKSLHMPFWRTKTGSMRDPFNSLDRGTGGDFGMESLQVK